MLLLLQRSSIGYINLCSVMQWALLLEPLIKFFYTYTYKKTESAWKREQVSLIPFPAHILPAQAEIPFCQPSFLIAIPLLRWITFQFISVGPGGLLSVSVYPCWELMLYLSPTLILNKIARLLVQRINFDVALACGRTHLLWMVL